MRRIIWTTLVAVAALVAAGAATAIIIHDTQRRRETGASQFVAAAMLAHELRLLWRAPGGRQGESMTIPATSIVVAPGARS